MLAKRYVSGRGSVQVHAISETAPAVRIHVLNVGAGEILSVFVRKRNASIISAAYFGQALLDFDADLVHRAHVSKVPVSNRLAISPFPLIVTHAINSTDAVILKSALTIARKLRTGGDDLILVASDLRLLRAAAAEGLATFNPETQDQQALVALLGP